MRTTQEIIRYYRNHSDFFGFTGEVLIPYLSEDEVKPFLKEGTDLTEWKQQPLTREYVIAEMRQYMEFAWGKVEDHRGISASRSVEKMRAWLWLLEDEDTRAFADDEWHYAQYGAPILKKICEVYGFPIPDGDDIRNMSQGKPCEEGCDQGCER